MSYMYQIQEQMQKLTSLILSVMSDSKWVLKKATPLKIVLMYCDTEQSNRKYWNTRISTKICSFK